MASHGYHQCSRCIWQLCCSKHQLFGSLAGAFKLGTNRCLANDLELVAMKNTLKRKAKIQDAFCKLQNFENSCWVFWKQRNPLKTIFFHVSFREYCYLFRSAAADAALNPTWFVAKAICRIVQIQLLGLQKRSSERWRFTREGAEWT